MLQYYVVTYLLSMYLCIHYLQIFFDQYHDNNIFNNRYKALVLLMSPYLPRQLGTTVRLIIKRQGRVLCLENRKSR